MDKEKPAPLTPNKGVPNEKVPPAMTDYMDTQQKTVHKPTRNVTETHVGGAPYKRG